jgi:hypothetical protein
MLPWRSSWVWRISQRSGFRFCRSMDSSFDQNRRTVEVSLAGAGRLVSVVGDLLTASTFVVSPTYTSRPLSKMEMSCLAEKVCRVSGRSSKARLPKAFSKMLVVICCWTTSAVQGATNIFGIVWTLNRFLTCYPLPGHCRNPKPTKSSREFLDCELRDPLFGPDRPRISQRHPRGTVAPNRGHPEPSFERHLARRRIARSRRSSILSRPEVPKQFEHVEAWRVEVHCGESIERTPSSGGHRRRRLADPCPYEQSA